MDWLRLALSLLSIAKWITKQIDDAKTRKALLDDIENALERGFKARVSRAAAARQRVFDDWDNRPDGKP